MTPKAMDPVGLHTKWNPLEGRPVSVAPGVAMPSRFTAILDLHGGGKADLEVEVVARVPRIVSITLRNLKVTATALRLPAQAWLDFVAASVAMVVDGTEAGDATAAPPLTVEEERDVERVTRTAVRRRAVITDDLLRRTADVYRSGRVMGIQLAFDVSEATAYRYVREARARGFLESRTSTKEA